MNTDTGKRVMKVRIGAREEAWATVVLTARGTLRVTGPKAKQAKVLLNDMRHQRLSQGMDDATFLDSLPRRLRSYIWAVPVNDAGSSKQ